MRTRIRIALPQGRDRGVSRCPHTRKVRGRTQLHTPDVPDVQPRDPCFRLTPQGSLKRLKY